MIDLKENKQYNFNINQRSMIKAVFNSLWGKMSEKVFIRTNIGTSQKLVYIEDIGNIKSILYPNEYDKDIIILSYQSDKIYRFNYARIGTFLTSMCRFEMIKVLLKNDFYKNIYTFNTDGFYVNEDVEFNETNFVTKHYKKIIVENSNCVKKYIMRDNKLFHVTTQPTCDDDDDD